MVRLLFAYSWGQSNVFADYPGRPHDVLAPPGLDATDEERAAKLTRVSQHVHSRTRGYQEYYNIFLYGMRMTGIIE